MKHYKNDPDLNAEINAIVAAELSTIRDENERFREALLGVRDCWVRPRSGLTDFGEREHFANIVRMNISKAKDALK